MLTKALIASLSLLAIAPAVQATDLPKQSYLSLELAQKAVNAALDKCKVDGYSVSVAVVDRGGNLLSQSRHPMAGPHTIGSSQGKAFASASMGRPSGDLAKMIGEKPFLEGLRDMDHRLVILSGGLPISFNGERVGGIGVGVHRADTLMRLAPKRGWLP